MFACLLFKGFWKSRKYFENLNFYGIINFGSYQLDKLEFDGGYLYDVVIEKEASISSQDDLITTGSGNESDSLYIASILQKILDVKRNSTSSVKMPYLP